MREKKTVFKWFTVAKYEEEQEYLRQMHQAGWKLVKVSFLGFYTFEKCEPEDVIYQLDYNQEREKGMAEKNIARLADETASEITDKEYNNIILGIDCEMEE